MLKIGGVNDLNLGHHEREDLDFVNVADRSERLCPDKLRYQ